MDTLNAYLPEDIYSMLVTGVIALAAILMVMFVVRKLIAIALVGAVVIGGWALWHDPAMLRAAQDSALSYYDQWRYGKPADEQRPRW